MSASVTSLEQNIHNNKIISRKRKNYFNCRKSQKIRNKNLIIMQAKSLSHFCNSIGLKIDEIILSPKTEEINIQETKITILAKNVTKDYKIFKCLMAKDLTNLSCRKYTILKQTLKEINGNNIPNIHIISNLQTKMNNFFQLQPNTRGFFIDPIKKIKYVCEKFLFKNPDFSKTKFKIKLSADGTNISKKNVKLLNFTFNLLDDEENAMNAVGCFTLGMFEIRNEEYEEVSTSLKETLAILESLKMIKIDEKTFNIEFYIGADYKMLRLLYGQKASNAAESCVWCRFNAKETPTSDTNFIYRNLSDIDKHLEPIINFIPFEKCVVDLLHLLLRITDQLYKLLIFKFIRLDKNDGINIDLRPNLKVFLTFLENECKITNPFYISDKELKLRNFNGNERIRIFEEIYKSDYDKNKKITKKRNFSHIFKQNIDPKFDFKVEDDVWSGFFEILVKIKSFKENLDALNFETAINNLRKDLKNWLDSYLILNEKYRNSKTITPYIHVFVFHIPQFLELHKNINIFNTQGLEKLNDFCTQYYMGCTNKQTKDKNYLSQLFNKRNRIEFFNLNGAMKEFHYDLNVDDNDDDNNNDNDNDNKIYMDLDENDLD